jgi:hypothetical protein
MKKMIANSILISGFWIRIRIGSGFNDFVDPDSESESRIRIQGQENNVKILFVHFSNFITDRSVVDPDPHSIQIQ